MLIYAFGRKAWSRLRTSSYQIRLTTTDCSYTRAAQCYSDDMSGISLYDALYLFTLSCAGVWLGYIAAMWTWPENLV